MIDRDQQMTPLQAAIWNFLREEYVGPEAMTPRAAILARFNLMTGRDLDDRKFREAVSELVTIYKKPICTTSAGGFYVARTMKDLDLAVRDLEAKGAACFERARALQETIPLERQERLF